MASKGDDPKEKEFLIALDEIFEDHAWNEYMKNKNIFRKLFCRRSQYYADVRWSYVSFKHKTKFNVRPGVSSEYLESDAQNKPNKNNSEAGNIDTTPKATPDAEKPEAENDTTNDTTTDQNKQDQENEEPGKDVELFSSVFDNKTQSEQTHSFNTTRTTTSSTSVEFQKAYTKGGECNIELSVPGDIVTVGAALSGQLSVTKTEGETFETSQSWTVDTNITVEKGHTTRATIKVTERSTIADFEVHTTMSILDGKDLPVAIRRASDDKVVAVVIIPDLRDVFYDLAEKYDSISFVKHKDTSRVTETRIRHDVVLVSRGTCKSVAWRNQRTEVKSEKIAGFVIEENDGDKKKEKDKD